MAGDKPSGKSNSKKPTPTEHNKFIKWFSELNKNSGNTAGGKGANLAEIYNLKIAVPPGFVVTAQTYDYFLDKAGITEKIKELQSKIDYEDTKRLNEVTKNIRAFITDSEMPKDMEEEILEAYDNLDTSTVDLEKNYATDILHKTAEPIFVAVRSSATTEDLAGASFAGQQDTYLNVKGKSSLIKHIKMAFASLFTPRATYYRNKKGFTHDQAHLAVVIQKMVDSDKSGVIFSKDPSVKNDNTIMEAVWGLGEGIVSGQINPDRYVISNQLELLDKKIAYKKIAITRDSSGDKTVVKLKEDRAKSQVLTEYEIKKLTEIALKLEDHYKKPQDIEFAIEGEEIYIVQTRPITTLESRKAEGISQIKGEPILTGLAASPGIASGKIKIVNNLQDLNKIIKGDIMVTQMTNPDMVVAMQKSAGIVTDQGGMTSHAAIVSREMGIPAVVGTDEATEKLKEGEIITVDGYTGKIYKGKVAETEQKEILPVTAKTKTEIKVIVDLPTFAKRASKSELKKVGLTRIEGIIAESGKHPEFFLKQNNINEYEEIIFKGIDGIAKYFDEMWVRTSDIRSDEFANLEGAPKTKEANPMLGFHGIRYSLKKPEILIAELKALKRVSSTEKKMGILMPQLITLKELQAVKKIIKEIEFQDLELGIMIETPAAVQIIKELCDEGIDFISFGTNDLTQYILAVDRGNEDVQDLFNEMDPAVLHQLEYVIRVCKRQGVQTSICGQAGSRKEMAKFLVEKGIDSISVNADMAKEISDYVAEIEKNLGEAPREYKPKKEEEKSEIARKSDNQKQQTDPNNNLINDNQKTGLDDSSNQSPSVSEEVVQKQPSIIDDKRGEVTMSNEESKDEPKSEPKEKTEEDQPTTSDKPLSENSEVNNQEENEPQNEPNFQDEESPEPTFIVPDEEEIKKEQEKEITKELEDVPEEEIKEAEPSDEELKYNEDEKKKEDEVLDIF